jgi:hypothetical protein
MNVGWEQRAQHETEEVHHRVADEAGNGRPGERAVQIGRPADVNADRRVLNRVIRVEHDDHGGHDEQLYDDSKYSAEQVVDVGVA